MSSEREETISSKSRTTTNTPTKPSEPEQLPCPRCDSTNTKFCYYNNYNLSQPRHFCKSCRRYWTRGGALRNVPIGGGTRRSSSSNKRPRTDSSAGGHPQEVLSSVPVSEMGNGSVNMGSFMGHCYDMNLNEALPETGSFSSLLNSEGHHQGGNNVFMGMPGRYVGVGVGSGLYGLGFGLNMFDFPMEQMRDVGGPTEGSGGGGGVSGGGNVDTWQLEGGNNNNNNNDNFSWPDLAISTPGKSLK